MPDVKLILGDCLTVLPTLDADSIDAVVTDPPAGISFMSASWDSDRGGRDEWIAWLASILREAYRVLKPGGYALVWAIPRTSHWTGMACEDAGFEVRDRISHLFATGFPKHHSSLKPACEDWWLCRKPLIGSVAANVAKYGTGALNIDGCRIGTAMIKTNAKNDKASFGRSIGESGFKGCDESTHAGRWPANLVLSHLPGCNGTCAPGCPVAMLDAQSGEWKSGTSTRSESNPARIGEHGRYGAFKGKPDGAHFEASSGGASRFFFQSKPSRRERERGCENLPERISGGMQDTADGSLKTGSGNERNNRMRNGHPTVKSIALMRYLIRLVTPPGGTVLDPFAGSGTTGIAAVEEGCSFVGIEREPEYFAIAEARIGAATCKPDLQVRLATDKDSLTVPADTHKNPMRSGEKRQLFGNVEQLTLAVHMEAV